MMASRSHTELCRPGDLLVVVHEFVARSPDELSLKRGDRVELIERDDDFGDGWFLGKNTETGDNGLFPEVYTRPAPKPAAAPAMQQRMPAQDQPDQPSISPHTATSDPLAATPNTEPLHIPSPAIGTEPMRRVSPSATPRGIAMTLGGELPREDGTVGSPVMHETLSVINEHITGMSTPRHSVKGKDPRTTDSESEYSSHHRLSYIHGQETDEEEQNLHTEDEVKTWSPARVADYLEDVGVEKKHCDVFRDQEIDGEALLGVDRNFIFMKEFDLGPMGPRLRTWMKVNALQLEVRNAKEAAALMPALDGHDSFPVEPSRNRASSTGSVFTRMPTHRDNMGSRGTVRYPSHRSNTSMGNSISSTIEPTSPLIKATPPSPSFAYGRRPSAASVRSLNHNRRHSSSIDYNQNASYAASPHMNPQSPETHKKTPSFDRNWTMGSPQKSPLDQRPSSSNHAIAPDANGTGSDSHEGGPSSAVDLDRGYFSGGEVDNRKVRNFLRKKDSPNHSRNPSHSTEIGRRASQILRHSRVGSVESMSSSISPAAKQYYGMTHKKDRSASAFDFVRPLKPTSEVHPTVTKLNYDAHTIDAIANSPHIPGSETSSTGRASPSPAAQSHSYSFFGKRARAATGLRAISDAITGGERANATAGDAVTDAVTLPPNTLPPNKDSPMQSPTRTGSTTPSGTSISKSFELEKPDLSKQLTNDTSSIKEGGRKKAKKHGTSAYLKGRQQITPQEAMQTCDYSGWMKKKSSSLMTTWKSRLFVLRGRRLSYYYSEDDTEEKGLIDISSHRVLPANDERMTGLHATITRAASSPSSPHNATIQTAASADTASGIEEDVEGMFIFKLVPPRAGLQRGVQFTKPIVYYFAVDSLPVGRLWMAALMKATIDRDESVAHTTTCLQKTISLEKARAMRQRPPNLMDEEDSGAGSERKSVLDKERVQGSTIHEEDEKLGLAIGGLRDEEVLNDRVRIGNEDGDGNLHAL